jgi:hypothetical protein
VTYGLIYDGSDNMILGPFFDKMSFDKNEKLIYLHYYSEEFVFNLDRY